MSESLGVGIIGNYEAKVKDELATVQFEADRQWERPIRSLRFAIFINAIIV